MPLKILDLFSGIGGFSLGLESTGYFETVAFCEKDEFCKKVLQKHWSHLKIYDDVRSLHDTKIQADVVTGGFPCQAFSQAGLQKGRADDRWLWNEMFDVIKQVRPRWVIGENVQGIVNIENGMVLRQVQDDLEGEGFKVQCFIIPASGIGAWHQRKRIWILASNSNNTRCKDRTEQHRGESAQKKERVNSISRPSSVSTRRRNGDDKDVSNSNSIRHRRGNSTRCANEEWTFLPREQEGGEMGSKTERRSNVSNSKSKRLQGFSNDSPSISTKRKKSKSRAKDSYETNAADTLGFGTQGEDARKHSGIKLHNSTSTERETWWQTESRICGIPDGVSYGVDKDRAKRIKALGNSIVPQIARQIGLAIMEAENDN
jgi:DNA (cytosine-5)-methyltransferase 1